MGAVKEEYLKKENEILKGRLDALRNELGLFQKEASCIGVDTLKRLAQDMHTKDEVQLEAAIKLINLGRGESI